MVRNVARVWIARSFWTVLPVNKPVHVVFEGFAKLGTSPDADVKVVGEAKVHVEPLKWCVYLYPSL